MKDQFDYLYWEGEQGSPKFWAVNMHPFVSGVPYRIGIVREALEYMLAREGVWPATGADILSAFQQSEGSGR